MRDRDRLSRWLSPRSGELFALLSVCVFAALMFWIYLAVSAAARVQETVRGAQMARGQTLKALLDMETGLRGYTSTGLRLFLQPYLTSGPKVGVRLEEENRTLRTLGSAIPANALVLAHEQSRLVEAWEAEVAAPLIADRRRPDANALQLRGKGLVDRFRANTDAIAADLARASGNASDSLNQTLERIALAGVVGLVGLYVLVRALGGRYAQLAAMLERERGMYDAEKRIADRLQTAFLQHALPRPSGVAVDAVYIPAETEALVGGDWFDAVAPDERTLFVSVGDVGGHGLDAGVTMNRAREAMLVAAISERDPSRILERVNAVLLLRGEPMVTAVCGFVDLAALSFRYAVAGHPSPIVARPGGSARFLGHGGIPLGVLSDVSYQTLHEPISAGSLLVLYTDGLTEFEREPVATEQRLLASVREIAATFASDPAKRISDALLHDAKPRDDVAVLTLSFAPRVSNTALTDAAQADDRLPAQQAHDAPSETVLGRPHPPERRSKALGPPGRSTRPAARRSTGGRA